MDYIETTIEHEARTLIARGVPIIPCNGKTPCDSRGNPLNDWHIVPITVKRIEAGLRGAANPAIGLKLGDYIDIEADSPEEEQLVAKLFEGCDPPVTPTYKSTRGKHRIYRADERLRNLGRAVVHFKNGSTAKLGIRIGANGKAAQSVIPPSPGREWEVSWDDVEPAPLPDVVVRRIIEAANPQTKPITQKSADSSRDVERARKYLAKIPGAVSGAGGHDATFHAACVLVLGFALDRDDALQLLREWNQTCQPPWGQAELAHKVDDALKQPGERGYLLRGDDSTAVPKAREIESYKPFPIDTLPAGVGDYVRAASTAIGCDPSFIALPLLGCLARAVGNRRVIRLKRTWTEPAIIWAAIIGKSGSHKTPALSAATAFLNRHQAKAIQDFEQAVSQHDQDVALYERDFAAWKRAKTTDPPPWKPEVPVCQRFVTTDCTIEALASLLHSQFDGVLIPRDELAGWLGGIAEYKGGKGSDLGHWLASWGAAPLTVDRKTGAVKMIHVPRASVSIVGGIQPAVLRQAIGQEHMQDGLCARLLLAMPDPKPVRWTDAIIDHDVEERMSAIFNMLIGMTSGADGDGNPEPFAMALSEGAKRAWVYYFNRHRAELSDLDDDLAAAWSKLEAYTARFALIFQLCAWAAGEEYASEQMIDEAAMLAAIQLSDWFGGEARRVYGLFCESELDRETRELVEWIGRKGGAVTARELQMSHRQYRAAGEAETALDGLAKAGFGQWHVVPTTRRPRREFRLSTVSTSTVFDDSREILNNVGVDNVDTPETQDGIPF